jgi:hypothetical protein
MLLAAALSGFLETSGSAGSADARQAGFRTPFTHLELDGVGGAWSYEAGPVLRLPEGARARARLSKRLHTDKGSLSFRVRPLGADWRHRSHTFLSMAWAGKAGGYLAVSQGWWEPNGASTLYFILDNQQFAFCDSFGGNRYEWFAAGRWTYIEATWTSGSPGRLALYVDGQKVCSRDMAIAGGVESGALLHVGSDEGATDNRGRPAGFEIRDLHYAAAEATPEEAFERYRESANGDEQAWISALLRDKPAAGHDRPGIEVMDEGRHWLAGRAAIDQTIDRLERAGVGTYIPCVWDGESAAVKSRLLPVDPRFEASLRAGDDLLAYLIERAHEHGIRVKLWFDVVRQARRGVLDRYAVGAPAVAFNVQDAGFRQFIPKAIADAYLGYSADGLNLDYVRSLGICGSETCMEDYRRRYGRDLEADHAAANGGADRPTLAEWNGDPVRRILQDLATRISAARPGTETSVDAVPFDHDRVHEGVDAAGWLAGRLIGRVYHMAYGNPIDMAGVARSRAAFGCDAMSVIVQDYRMIGERAVDHSGRLLTQVLDLAASEWPGCNVGIYHYPHLTDSQVEALSTWRRDPASGTSAGGARP